MEEAYLLAEISPNNTIVFEKNVSKSMHAASLIKVFYALEALRLLEEGKISNKSISITKDMINDYGTNVLADIVSENTAVNLNIYALIFLMLKYSCNSATKIILDNFLPDRKSLNKIADELYGLDGVRLIDENGDFLNEITILDLFKLYSLIYGEKKILNKENDFLQQKLSTGRGIYYLFDQLGVKILGSKTGTLLENGNYWVGDSGVIEINGKQYFMAAIVKDISIQKAVIRVRDLGKEMVKLVG